MNELTHIEYVIAVQVVPPTDKPGSDISSEKQTRDLVDRVRTLEVRNIHLEERGLVKTITIWVLVGIAGVLGNMAWTDNTKMHESREHFIWLLRSYERNFPEQGRAAHKEILKNMRMQENRDHFWWLIHASDAHSPIEGRTENEATLKGERLESITESIE